MTAAAVIVAVKRAEYETPCRRCDRVIERGQRAALVLGTGAVHLRCLLVRQAGTTTTTGKDPTMATDTYGHHYDENQPVLTCTQCGVAQAAARDHGIPCDGGPAERRVNALAGMHAAVEYARTMFGGMSGGIDPVQVQEGLDFIRGDCMRARPPLDILGSLASITLRAAQKSVALTGGTVPQFLDELEAELTHFGESPA